MRRCLGHCCEQFVLSEGGPYWTAAYIEEWKEQDKRGEIDLGDHNRQVLNMVIPVEDAEYCDVEGDRMPIGAPYTLFTCKNFNTETRDCTIYEARPEMCRSAGEDNLCSYDECTLKDCAIRQAAG